MPGSYTTKKVATIIAAKHFVNISYQNITNSSTTDVPTFAGVNVLLIGVLVGCAVLLLAFICYLWDWNFDKNNEPSRARYNTRVDSWVHLPQVETPMHIFTLENQDTGGDMEDFEVPPPSYDEVVKNGDPDLPSYEAAVNLSARGYV